MAEIAEAFRLGGIWMYLIIALGMASGGWICLQALLHGNGTRLPAVAWWAGPSLVLVCGAVGTYVGVMDARSALEHVSADNRREALARGAALAMNTAASASIVSAVLGLLATWGTALGRVVGASESSSYTWTRPLAAGALATLTSLGLAGWSAASGLGFGAIATSALLFLGASGAAIAAAPIDDDSVSAGAAAADRFSASLGVVVSTLSAGAAATMITFIDGSLDWEVGMQGAVAATVALAVGVILSTVETEELSSRQFLLEALLAVAAFLPAIGTTGLAATELVSIVGASNDAPSSSSRSPSDDRNRGARKEKTAGTTDDGAADRNSSGDEVSPRPDPSPAGGCDRADVRNVVGANSDQIQYCYEKELQNRPELAGRIVVAWTIAGDGSVRSATIDESTLDDSGVESCVLRSVRRLEFDAPPGDVCNIRFPFDFDSK